MANKFGLQRYIPQDIALEVRRRSKFGCVMCRCAIYQYEHLDPEYAEAKVHDPDKICLLCGGCHDRVTRGRLSKDTVKARYLEVQESSEISRPFEELDLSAQNISVEMGTAKFDLAHHLLRINGRDLLSITPPKEGPDVMGGTPVFADTRVPVQTLLDYLEAGDSIDDFLAGFPSVSRGQVIEFLEQAKDRLVAAAS